MQKLSSLTIFFPFFNDEGTVEKAIKQAYQYGTQVTEELEVIAIHGGRSKDDTWGRIQAAKKKFPKLRVINKVGNRQGYAVIKHGFLRATKEWVFYTDGDLQYFVKDLLKLVEAQLVTDVTVVNGYKVRRGDGWFRIFIGRCYALFARKLFHLPIRDVDCDFRLIWRGLLKGVSFESKNASILPELIVKLKDAGAVFVEVPVRHRKRRYGRSNYGIWRLVQEKWKGDFRLWKRLREMKSFPL